MKRRNALDGKPRRPVKRAAKIGENFYGSSTLVYIKLLLLWGLVLLADHFLEFRFEYLWPFWLFLRSVYDSFKYQGLAFSVFFVCIAITSDMICFLFIPVHWLFFAASTYVWVQYVWHTEKGFCLPTVFLWLLFVYIEASIRLKEFKAHIDLKHLPFHLDLCRPFAAHCIGYPVVTLGFGFKSYVGYRMRQRRQKEVQKENEYYYEFLREALPPGPIREEAFSFNPQPSPKPGSEDRISTDPATATSVIAPSTPSAAAASLLSTTAAAAAASLSSSACGASAAASAASVASSGASVLSWNGDSSNGTALGALASLSSTSNGTSNHNNHVGGKVGNGVANGSLGTPFMANGLHSNSSSGELDYMEKMRDEAAVEDGAPGNSSSSSKRSAKSSSYGANNSIPRDTSRKGRGGDGKAVFTKEETISKMEADIKKLKVELQLSRNKENDLREQIVTYMSSERTLKSEISTLQVEKSVMETRINALMSTRAVEKASLSSLEKKLADERKQKAEFQIKLETERKTKKEAANAERTAQQDQTRSEVAKLEAEIKTLRGELAASRDRCDAAEREAYQLRSYKDTHGDPEVLVKHITSMREKTRQLEIKLSDETKLKMGLFSALGGAEREISIRDGFCMKKDKEIADLKAKIAEVLACMPTSGAGSNVATSSSHVSQAGATGGGLSSYGGGNSALSLDLPAATELSFNSGKMSGLGLADLGDKLAGLGGGRATSVAGLYTPASLSGSAFTPKTNGNSNMDA